MMLMHHLDFQLKHLTFDWLHYLLIHPYIESIVIASATVIAIVEAAVVVAIKTLFPNFRKFFDSTLFCYCHQLHYHFIIDSSLLHLTFDLQLTERFSDDINPLLSVIELLAKSKLLIILRSLLSQRIIKWLVDLTLCSSFSSHLRLSLSKLLLTLNSWPINSITNRLTTATKYWEWIEPCICTENLLPVFFRSNVINTLKRLSKFIKIFNCCFIFASEHKMEF